MSFADDLNRFVAKTKATTTAVYVGTATKVQESVKGSGVPGMVHPITGAPGQPVDTGNLRNSWTLRITPTEATISTNVKYAPAIEDGVGRYGTMRVRSAVGGFHSVKLTVGNANGLQREAVREATR